jgi:hypothetical protein
MFRYKQGFRLLAECSVAARKAMTEVIGERVQKEVHSVTNGKDHLISLCGKFQEIHYTHHKM